MEQEQGQDGDTGDRHPVVGGDHQLDETLEDCDCDHDEPDRRVPAEDGERQAHSDDRPGEAMDHTSPGNH